MWPARPPWQPVHLALMDADAIQMVNKRVSDLGDYKTVAEAGIYFPTGVTDLMRLQRPISTKWPRLPCPRTTT